MAFGSSSGIERELAPVELLLWKGRPQGGIKFRSQDAFGIPFLLLWCAGVSYAGYGMVKESPRGDFPFALIVLGFFAAMGFYFLIGRFFADAYTRSKMEYALTDRRALIVTNTFSRKVRSIDYRSEPNILLSEHSGGSGTIYFGDQAQSKSYGNQQLVSSGSLSGFEFIDNARDVYQRILKAKEAGIRSSESSPSPR